MLSTVNKVPKAFSKMGMPDWVSEMTTEWHKHQVSSTTSTLHYLLAVTMVWWENYEIANTDCEIMQKSIFMLISGETQTPSNTMHLRQRVPNTSSIRQAILVQFSWESFKILIFICSLASTVTTIVIFGQNSMKLTTPHHYHFSTSGFAYNS